MRPPLKPDPQEVADRLHSAAIHLLRRVATEDAHSGLSAARLSALSVIVHGGPLTLGALAAAERVRPPTMSNTVAGLVGDGLVRRRAAADDGRSVEVLATPKGRRLLGRARQRRLAVLADALAQLDPAELKTVAAAGEIIERVVSGPLAR